MTHQIIRVLVYADTKEEARETAEQILDNLVGDGKPFDYGTFFDDETSKSSGKARWGDIPAVVEANSKEGKKLIKKGLKFTRDDFKENLKKVRKLINKYNDKELFEEELNTKKRILVSLGDKEIEKELLDLKMFRYYCYCLGQYQGIKVWLYDYDGEGIKSNSHLKDVLTKWNEGKRVWVVPIDVHS